MSIAKRSEATLRSISSSSTRLSAPQSVAPVEASRVAAHGAVECLVEGQREHGRLAVELELRLEQRVALRGALCRQRCQSQALDGALGDAAHGGLHPLHGGLERERKAVYGGRRHARRVGVHWTGTPPSMGHASRP
jgi:hypothetical protein